MDKTRLVPVLIGVVPALLIVLIATGSPRLERPIDAIRSFVGLSGGGCSPEPGVIASLKTIATAQEDFRANDRGGDHSQAFWRPDISGLYGLSPQGGPPIRLLERSLALADDRPRMDLRPFGERSTTGGFWYRAIPHADEHPPDPWHRFAVCALPAFYPKPIRWTYLIDENNAVFRRDLGQGRGLEVFPTSEELKQWTRME